MKEQECPLIPMGAVTGHPDRKFMRERLKKWRSFGVTQFLIYARSGLEVEYMTDDWFQMCQMICEEAQKLGFTSIWLYDEKNWPSGSCNGEVIRENPDYAINALCVRKGKKDGYEFVLRKGRDIADLMNPEAVDCFLRLTHERYRKHLGKYFGTLIKGIFTDEPDVAFFSDARQEGDLKILPYYHGLEEDYFRLTGGRLKDDVVRALKTGTDFYTVPCNRLIAKRFRECYPDRVSRWCAQYGMVLTGHLMNEYSAAKALPCNGHILHVLSGFTLPGIDEIYTHTANDKIEYLTLATGMYAIEKQGSRGGLAELFALGPCDNTPGKMVWQFYFCAAFGIDRYVLAVAQTVARGNVGKKDYFNILSEAQPWSEAFKDLGEEAKRAAVWARKKRACEIAVRYPYEPEPLTDLLRHLSDAQFGWKLVMPEETTDAEFILSCRQGEIVEERSGKSFFDFSGLNHDFLSKVPRKMLVCTPDGAAAHGVFLRRYEDGSALVFDQSGETRDLVLNAGDASVPFHLPATGVFAYEPGIASALLPDGIFDLPKNGWQITIDSPNTMRADFENGKCFFTLTEDMDGLKFAVRNYGDKVSLLLDGEKVNAASRCTALPQGFREIYRETEAFSLSKGPHELALVTDGEDYPYLPSVLLTGHFAVSNTKEIGPYRDNGAGLYGYAGKITLKRSVNLPKNARFLRAETFGLCAELSVNGKALGRVIRDPFCWQIPAKTAGKTEIELVLSTSCARLFGEKAFYDPHAWAWLNLMRPHNEKQLLYYKGKK